MQKQFNKVEYRSLGFMGYPNYRVGDDGSVWSFQLGKWKEKRQTLIKEGMSKNRFVVCIWNAGRGKTHLVHRLVLFAFRGEAPEGMQCCHNDGNSSNNNLTNLRWGSHQENQLDRRKHGTDNRGEKHWKCVLTVEQVKEIRRLYKTGKQTNKQKLAAMFHVSDGTIRSLLIGRSWRHIP